MLPSLRYTYFLLPRFYKKTTPPSNLPIRQRKTILLSRWINPDKMVLFLSLVINLKGSDFKIMGVGKGTRCSVKLNEIGKYV
jgi:hypothetical protein